MPEGHTQTLDREFLQSILDGIEESIVILDKDYHIVCHNTAFIQWLDKPKKKTLGECCYSVIHDQPVRCTPCIVRETFRTGQFFETSHSHEKGGRKVYHETKSYPIKGADNEVRHVIYIFRDITEKALIEERVRELDKFKKKRLDNAGVAINILDGNGGIMNANKGSEELFGYAEDEVKGEPHSVFYRAGDKQLLMKVEKEALDKGRFMGEVTLVKKNRNEFPADLTLTTVEDDSGKVVALIEIVNDLTQIKKAERLIKQQLERLQRLDATKEEYFYATSHEFKTPLTSIVSLSKMLSDGKIGELTDKQKEAVSLIYCDAKRLRSSVQRILDIAKIEAGKMVYNFENVQLEPIVDEVLSTLKVLIDSKSLKVGTNVGGKIPLVWADKEKLMLVLENLVNNAIKFTPQGGSIDVKASKEGDHVLVEVRDTGVGIPDEDREKIFEKYYQVEHGEGYVGGSGLGLVICKRVVEDFGGRIWAESTLGEGSTFKFTIPYKKEGVSAKKRR